VICPRFDDVWQSRAVIDEFAKEYLHNNLREARDVLVWKLEGLAESDVRRPLTPTGTSLLGLVKHLTNTEGRYLGDVFDRPPTPALPAWDADGAWDNHAATEAETHAEIVGAYQRAWAHSDTTIEALAIDAEGFVPWWPRPHIKLFNALVHVLNETNRHAGHADILREELDGATGFARWASAS
jgi:hypothetical protein